jgi:Ubiquitin carboxyl-terminal hydrolase
MPPCHALLPSWAVLINAQTFDKRKCNDKLSIPLTLDLQGLLAAAGSSMGAAGMHAAGTSLQYELVAVLIHKGASASHGHYGALSVAVVFWCCIICCGVYVRA